MKSRQILSLLLSVVLTIANLNVAFADTINAIDEDVVIVENIAVSDSAVGVDESAIVALENASVEFAGGDGTEENPYQIATSEQLDAVRYNLTANYEIINNITLNEQWNPIGDENNVFTGSLNGNFHTIYNLKILDNTECKYAGLFGYANTSVVSNLNLDDVDIIAVNECTYINETTGLTEGKGTDVYAGSIIAYGKDIKLINCHVVGNVKTISNLKKNAYSGGLIGKSIGICNLNGCTSSGNITGDSPNANVGGIAGYLCGNIYDCNSNANIKGYASTPAIGDVKTTVSSGGIIGCFCFINSTVSNCCFEGIISNISSRKTVSGGIVGSAIYSGINTNLIIDNCNSDGIIESYSNDLGDTISGGIIGDIVPYDSHSGKICVNISNSFSNSKITAHTKICAYSNTISGGIIGRFLQNNDDPLAKTDICLSIKASYSTGNIISYYDAYNNGYSEKTLAGGLIGYMDYSVYPIIIDDCFSTGNIDTDYSGKKSYLATINSGGLFGRVWKINTINHCWYSGCKSVGIYSYNLGNTPECHYNQIGENGTVLNMLFVKDYEVGVTTDVTSGLSATLSPHLDDKSGIIWESSNPNVVEIVDTSYIDGTNSDSLLCNINCKALGTSTITVTTADGASASCLVTVTEPKLEVVSVKYDKDLIANLLEETIEIEFNKNVNILDGKMELYYGDTKLYDIYNTDTLNYKYNGNIYYMDESQPNKIYISIAKDNINNVKSVNYEGVEDLSYYYSSLLPYKPLKIIINKSSIVPIDENITFDNISIDIDFDDYNLNYPEDIFRFTNSPLAFNSEHYDLNSRLSNRINAKNQNIIYKLRNETKWEGSCFGMSSFVGMVKNNLLNLSNIDESGLTVNELPMPRDSIQVGGVRDWINYIQLLQYDAGMKSIENVDSYKIDSLGEAWTVWDKEHGIGSSNSEYTNVLKTIINNAQLGKTDYTFDFAWISDGKICGHTLLPFYYYYNNDLNEHKVVCYDPSTNNMITVVTIDQGLKNCSIEGWTNDPVRIGYTNLSDFSQKFDFSSIKENSEHKQVVSDTTELILKSNKNFDLSSKNGRIEYRNGIFSGNLDIIEDFDIISDGVEDASSLVFLLKDSEFYEISSTDDELDCILVSPDMFAYSKTEGNNLSVKFNVSDNKITSQGNISLYSSALSYNSDNMIVARGNNEEYVVLDKNNSLTVDTSNNNSIDIDFVKNGELEKTEKVLGVDNIEIIDDGNELKIKDDDNDSIIMGDIDGNGMVARTDLVSFAKYFAAAVSDIVEKNADLNGDGQTTRADLVQLAKYFAGAISGFTA